MKLKTFKLWERIYNAHNLICFVKGKHGILLILRVLDKNFLHDTITIMRGSRAAGGGSVGVDNGTVITFCCCFFLFV